MIFLVLSVAAVTAQAVSVPTEESRSGKFIPLQYDQDLISAVFDEAHDPLPSSERDNTVNTTPKEPDPEIRPVYHPETDNDVNGSDQSVHEDGGNPEEGPENFLVTKDEIPASGIIYYEGHQFEYHEPVEEDIDPENGTEPIKLFWNSVTDAIENIPFLPVQVNVPEMISAMANFLSSSIPIINRFTNPNNPRLPKDKDKGDVNGTFSDNFNNNQYGSNTLYDSIIEDRQLKGQAEPRQGQENKRRKSDRPKGASRPRRKNKRGTNKGLINRPFFKSSTEASPDDMKVWANFGSGGQTRPSLKNMPITRKKFHLTDREVFNFKNSDITNSPIMILNIPSRPMFYYKTKVQQTLKDGNKSSEVPPHMNEDAGQTVITSAKKKTERKATNSRKSPSAKRVRNNGRQKEQERGEKGGDN